MQKGGSQDALAGEEITSLQGFCQEARGGKTAVVAVAGSLGPTMSEEEAGELLERLVTAERAGRLS